MRRWRGKRKEKAKEGTDDEEREEAGASTVSLG